MTFPNENGLDRTLRIVVGLALLYGAWTIGMTPVGITLLVLGIIGVGTGVIGFCALYALFGLSTRHART